MTSDYTSSLEKDDGYELNNNNNNCVIGTVATGNGYKDSEK